MTESKEQEKSTKADDADRPSVVPEERTVISGVVQDGTAATVAGGASAFDSLTSAQAAEVTEFEAGKIPDAPSSPSPSPSPSSSPIHMPRKTPGGGVRGWEGGEDIEKES